MKKSSLVAVLLLSFLSLRAQYGGPRLFLDVPSIYLHTPDVEHIGDRIGAGAEIAMNVGTHWSVARLGGGTTFTFKPTNEEFNTSSVWGPYAFIQAGAGMYRSNGNQCAKSHQSAFTALGKLGMRYNFNEKAVMTKNELPEKLDFTLGVELGYFYITDVFRNTEFVVSADYMVQNKVIAANLGFKFFLNLRANR